MIEYCCHGTCNNIGTEKFGNHYTCEEHRITEKLPPGRIMDEDKIYHLCGYSGCNAYAVYYLDINESSDPLSFMSDTPSRLVPVCAKHIFTQFLTPHGEVKHSRKPPEQPKEKKNEQPKSDDSVDKIMFE